MIEFKIDQSTITKVMHRNHYMYVYILMTEQYHNMLIIFAADHVKIKGHDLFMCMLFFPIQHLNI